MNIEEIAFFRDQNLEYINTIAQGGFGLIFYVYNTLYKSEFALKKIPIDHFNQSEIDSLLTIDDPHIVRLYKYYIFNGYVYLLMEYCPSDLEKFLSERQKYTSPCLIQNTLSEVAKCVKACHDHKIAHCDIKPSNFLVDKYGRLKIADFGMATMCNRSKPSASFHGTLLFMAPEIFGINYYNPSRADIWAMGVTMYYIVTGQYPFNGLDQRAVKDSVEKGIYNQEPVRDSLLRDLISRCLETDLMYRATIDEVLSHPYFEKTFSHGIMSPNQRSTDNIVRPSIPNGRKLNRNRSHNTFNLSSFSRVRSQIPTIIE